MLAGRERLHTIIGIIDRNNIQIDGFVHDVMPSVEPLAGKWRSFGWHVVEIDGHNFYDIYNGVSLAQSMSGMPSVIIAHTIPGKGVPEYERDFRLHGYPPDKKQAAEVLHRLRTLNGAISSEHQ